MKFDNLETVLSIEELVLSTSLPRNFVCYVRLFTNVCLFFDPATDFLICLCFLKPFASKYPCFAAVRHIIRAMFGRDSGQRY